MIAATALLLLTSLGATGGATPGSAKASGGDCYGDLPGDFPSPKPATKALRFGIYPGGPAGVIAGPRPPSVPEDQGKIDTALDRLRGDGSFTVHLYTEFNRRKTRRDAIRAAVKLAKHYTDRGMRVEYVVRYRPVHAPNVIGFGHFIRAMVRGLGPNAGVTGIQVTNEVNNGLSPDASDGAYKGATRAIVRGIEAGKVEARRVGHRQLRFGFNWFYRMDPQTESDFWGGLAAKGGKRFARLLDWMGLDAYPGTFFPPTLPPSGSSGDAGDAMLNALSTMRCFADSADIPDSVPIRVIENGWPTSPARTAADQATELRDMVEAVNEYRANYNVTDYRWFDLRDSNSSDPDFQQQFGLTRDDYSPKPAFDAYRSLIAQLGS